MLFPWLIVWYRQAQLPSKLICRGSSDMPKCCWQMTPHKTLNFLHQYNDHTTFPLQKNVMIPCRSPRIKLSAHWFSKNKKPSHLKHADVLPLAWKDTKRFSLNLAQMISMCNMLDKKSFLSRYSLYCCEI